MTNLIRLGVVLSALTLPTRAPSQGNLMYHYDGTTEFTSRGVGGTAQKMVLQRVPADQLCGATMLYSVTAVIQDQDASTAEGPITLEIRGDGVPPNSPNMAGAICSLPLAPIPFGGTGVVAMKLTITLATPCVLPGICSSPAGDIYLGFGLPAVPNWPTDGISVHISANELHCPSCVPYPASPYPAGSPIHSTNLGWDVGFVGGAPSTVHLGTLNRAWNIGGRYREDTMQPYADNPLRFTGGAAGNNPNFGYAGIWPDASLGDGLGFNVQSSLPVGSAYFLLLGFELCPGLPLPPNLLTPDSSQILCLMPFVVLGPVLTVAPPPCLRWFGGAETSVSQASFGPITLPFVSCGNNGSIRAQGVGIAGSLLQVSTSCRVDL